MPDSLSPTPLARNLDASRLAALHGTMLRIRAFEEAAVRGLAHKAVLGAIHPSIGQEAVAAGICLNLRRDDVLLSTHRGHGHTLAKGADPLAMMRELFGREGGTSNGKGGSMHIADFSVGMLGANGVVSANIVIAAGAAHALKLQGRRDAVVVCIFGDGAINRGPFLEGLNWAGVFGLPVLFVCEDNGFAATTRTRAMTAGGGPSVRARGLGIPALEVDGNDVLAVDAAAREALDSVRSGAGPRFLHAHTYRLTGHTAADAAGYRPAEEVAERWKADPIVRAEEILRQAGLGEAEVGTARIRAEEEMEEVFRAALATPYPPLERAFADVQDAGDPREDAF